MYLPRVAVACVLVVLTAACSNDKKSNPADEGKGAPGDKVPAAVAPAPRRVMPAAQAIASINADEVRSLLPKFARTRVMKELTKAEVGERIDTALCFDEVDRQAIQRAIESAFTAAGWTEVRVVPHPDFADRVNVSATKAPYLTFGSLQQGQWTGCDGAQGQSYLVLGIQKTNG